MYKSFKIRNFRCFKELDFDDFAQINLIAGVNNIGKTALLEAIFLHGGAYNPELTLKINAVRGIETVSLSRGTWIEHPLSSFFNQFDVSKSIELAGEDTLTGYRSIWLRAVGESIRPVEASNQGAAWLMKESDIEHVEDEPKGILSSSEVAKVLELEYKEAGEEGIYRMIMDGRSPRVRPLPPAPPFQSYFQSDRVPEQDRLSEQAGLYGNLEINMKQNQVLRILRVIEPRLKSIRTIAVAGGAMLHADIGVGRLIPLPLMGAGMLRLANLAVYIGNAPNGVVLVDEIENGLHYSVMSTVWKAVALAARESDTQIFATTHSWECIRAAHEAFTLDGKYDFRLHRLGWVDGKIGAVTYDQETLDAAIKAGLEVR
jgi:hypothetical protein